MKLVYMSFLEQSADVDWKGLVMGNQARPRAKIVLWLACHGRLATKDILVKFGFISDSKCEFCAEAETLQHLFFECRETQSIWKAVMRWLHMEHHDSGWLQVKDWGIKLYRSRNWRKNFFKIALPEIIYAIWMLRNRKVYRKDTIDSEIVTHIIENIVNRAWVVPKLRENLAFLMMYRVGLFPYVWPYGSLVL
ncbi:uncharacterized protein LOC131649019 [Vicia villosa]|uniref:uncharacterized protein LOC131649019 n=1 Tax=Vicia villosa TaxID=3911 RepID=UPI00273B4543|nr:uncharacterized protein LOC131649019 [Vicia villosa]